MATGFIFNGFGKYETKDGVLGITLRYAGVEFFLPYQEVTAIPNFTLREVDHDKSTPQGDSVGELVYTSVIVPGVRVAEELCDKQIPTPNRDMGIMRIEGKPTGKTLEVLAGWNAEGERLTAEVNEREPTKGERAEAEKLAETYKRSVIADYFQSKRERMTGGRGRIHTDKATRLYMEELGVEDIDDVTAHAKNSGLNPELLRMILEEVTKATSSANADAIVQAVDSIRKAGKAQLSPNSANGRRSAGLAERAAAYDAAQAAKEKT